MFTKILKHQKIKTYSVLFETGWTRDVPIILNIFPIILFRNSGNNHLLFSNLIPIILVIILNSQSKIILIVKICYCTVA